MCDYSQLQTKIHLPSINIIFLIFFPIAIPAKIFIRTLTKGTLEDLKKYEIDLKDLQNYFVLLMFSTSTTESFFPSTKLFDVRNFSCIAEESME